MGSWRAASTPAMGDGAQFEGGDERGTFESAQKSFALERGLYPRQEAASRVDLASGYMRTGDYQQALEHYEQARALFHSVGDKVSEAIALGNLGIIYCDIKEYPKALQLYAQARPIFQSQRFPLFVARNRNLTGNALLAFGQPRRALDHYRRALALFEAEKREGEAGVTLAHIGKAHLRLHQTTRALDFLNRGLALIRKVGNPDEAFALESLGDVYREASASTSRHWTTTGVAFRCPSRAAGTWTRSAPWWTWRPWSATGATSPRPAAGSRR